MFRVVLFLFVFACGQLYAQDNQYSKVKVWLLDKSIDELSQLSVAVDHGSHKKNVWLITDLSLSEIEEVQAAGFTVDVLIADVKAHYRQQNVNPTKKSTKAQNCGLSGFEIPLVQNYSNGSMGGFFTYQEMLENLDSMASKYPNLISARAPIDTFLSIENRPIEWLRISSNPASSFSKPAILYTALHHAREPGSMQQLIYYMWYVLENYESNEELQYVVDNVEMYFVPCINPDGYVYNELTDPNGGGMHRKNRRNVGTNNKGVDLNRNYSYEYGGAGTSGNPNSETYKGTGPFSEPETQAMEWFIINNNFKIALNYHSYADALLFPWGYEDNFQCPDHDLLSNLTDYLTQENNYDNYQSALLYEAAGDSDDWAYGEQNDKPKVYAMTPEIGGNNDGFWPSQQNILGICRENVFQNFAAAKSLLDAYQMKDLSASIIENPNFSIDIEFQRLGLESGTYTLSIDAIDATINNANNPQLVSGLNFGEKQVINFNGELDVSSIQNMQITFVLQIATANYSSYDTLVKYFGETQLSFDGTVGTLDAWENANDWGLDNDAYSAPTSISDSPNGNYSNNAVNELISNVIDLSEADIAVLEFYAKWDIEKGYDFVQLSASLDGTNWTPLCGNYTVIGNDNQDENEPIYDGVQSTWVKESLDLNDFIGENIQLRFRIVSDMFTRGDGFNFDDLKIRTIGESPASIRDLFSSAIRVFPNPTKESVTITTAFKNPSRLEIINILGQSRMSLDLLSESQVLTIEMLPAGMYFLNFYEGNKLQGVKKLLIEE